MSFLREKDSRHFFYSLIAISILLLLFGGVFCIKQIQSAKKVLMTHDSMVVSSLLKQGVSPDIIASAVANTKDDGKGKSLLLHLGYTERTSSYFLPAVSDFGVTTFQSVLLGTLIFIVILLVLSCIFLTKRERLYNQASKRISAFSEGDFSEHLPRSGEGNLYHLFASVDNLASALQAKGDAEYKSKEFLKNTISDISHQLKTPLAALSMYNEIILEETDNPETITKFSIKTTAALERMEQLIQSLLKITCLDAGSITFEKAEHQVSEIVEKAIENLTTRALREEKQIIVNEQANEQLTCDLQWTSEAVGNIIKNALDHTNSGGHIRISWEKSPAMVRLKITDDGAGIAPEDIHHIFKRFYRSRNSKDTQGVGLGLSLAKSIVEGQGGTLSVQSILNRGTTFILSFLTEL
jgi:signal transduction histidine kinase